jgi:hypothetical protein
MEYHNSQFFGPFCFLYVNDFPINTQGANLVLFADNTNLLITEQDESALTHKIKTIMKENWFHKNNIIIHIEETIAMSFHTARNKLPVRPQINEKNMEFAYKSGLKFYVPTSILQKI